MLSRTFLRLSGGGSCPRAFSTIPTMYIPGSMPEKTLYVIDATSLLFTTWFAKEHTRSNVIFTTRNGVDCRALAHMVGRLCYFMGTVRPNYIALTFDARNVIKRDLYPEYKATRKDKDPALLAQLSLAQSFFEALGFPCFSAARHEADDVMATLSRYCAERGLVDVVVHVSPDKDMHQLVSSYSAAATGSGNGSGGSGGDVESGNERKTQVVIMPKMLSSAAALLEHDIRRKYSGLAPSQLCDLYALAGDSSDNIPGVRGVGHVVGTALISKYSNVETLFRTMTADGLEEALVNTRRKGAAMLARLEEAGLERVLLFRSLVQLQDGIESVTLELAEAEEAARAAGLPDPALSCFSPRLLLAPALERVEEARGAVRVSYRHGFPPAGSPGAVTADGDEINVHSPALVGSYRFLAKLAAEHRLRSV